MSAHPSHQKIALVAGANKGIGRAAAEQLAEMGMTVLIGAGDPRRGEDVAAVLWAAGRDAYAVALDVTDQASVRAAAQQLEADFGHLDVLINNAGITGSGRVSPEDATDQIPSSVDLDVVREVFETNVFGVIAVTNAMLPLLRRSPMPRIFNVSSHAASLTLASDSDPPFASLMPSAAYTPSKAALSALDRPVRQRTAQGEHPRQRRCPGYVATDSNNHSGHLTPGQGAAVLVRLATLEAGRPTAGFFSEDGPVPWTDALQRGRRTCRCLWRTLRGCVSVHTPIRFRRGPTPHACAARAERSRRPPNARLQASPRRGAPVEHR
jgi:NAD(P)-dependent dehydrogenase (short-subunit alcohol dehydrogenase family)